MIVPTSLFPEQLDVNRIMHIYSPEDIDVLEESERNDVLIFWKRCILNYCLVNKTFVVSLQQLHSFYEIHDVVPSSLPSSFKNLVKTEELLTSMSTVTSQSTTEIALSWMKYVGSYILPTLAEDNTNKNFIYKPVVKLIVENILLKYAATLNDKDRCFYVQQNKIASTSSISSSSSYIDANLTFKLFINRAIEYYEKINTTTDTDRVNNGKSVNDYALACLRSVDDSELTVVSDYLVQSNNALFLDNHSVIYIQRPLSRVTTTVTTTAAAASTEVPLAYLKLRNSQLMLHHRLEALEQKINTHHRSALSCKNKGDTTMALMQLRMKKTASHTRDRLAGSLLSLTEVIEVRRDMTTCDIYFVVNLYLYTLYTYVLVYTFLFSIENGQYVRYSTDSR